jgi:hypothetical protein
VDILYNNASALCNGLLMEGTCQRGCLTEIWGRAGERVPPPLVPGDVVTLEVEGLGTVRNRVVDPARLRRSRRPARAAPRPAPLRAAAVTRCRGPWRGHR